ncbi:50S ribosomal protein L32e [Nanoarchaeota archaeon]
MKELIELRKKIKSKKPNYSRQDSHKKKRLGSKWRRPKGLQSKMRLRKKGYKRSVEIGFGSPKAVKRMHKSGLMPVLVYALTDLKKIRPDKEGIVIGQTVGKRKKLELIKKADELKIKVLNVRDTAKYTEEVTNDLAERKKTKTEKLAKKAKKKAETKPKKEEKKKVEEETKTEEEKEKEAKLKKEKLLIKKE